MIIGIIIVFVIVASWAVCGMNSQLDQEDERNIPDPSVPSGHLPLKRGEILRGK